MLNKLIPNIRHLKQYSRLLFTTFFISLSSTLHAQPNALNFLVIAPHDNHIAWHSAKQFAQLASPQMSIKPILASSPSSVDPQLAPDIFLMPLRSLATQIPALEALELPFFYDNIDATHRAIDGKLGKKLRQISQQSGWKILSFLDEGMHVMSGNRRYNDRVNLSGMSFLELRPDPMAKKQFLAFNAWTETTKPKSQQALLEQCRVASRSTTLQRIWFERLDRVHLALSLSRHRYEGLVLIVPTARWNSFPESTQAQLKALAAQFVPWQRKEAQKFEDEALAELKKSGMTLHPLSQQQRQTFKDRLPLWQDLLSEKLSLDERKALIATATADSNIPLK